LKIAIIGTRGIPANYGGFETFAEECSARLAERGHSVTVYCRAHYVPKNLRKHRGANLVVLPTLQWKYTDTVVHSALSVVHALFRRFDLVLICNAANSPFAWMPRILGIPVVINVDGIERLRRKWNRWGKAYYQICEHLSVWFATSVVTDAKTIQDYYRRRHRHESVFIPYGASSTKPLDRSNLDRLQVKAGDYFLYVSRFEPENNPHVVVAAFEKVRSSKRLIMVGDAPYARDYIEQVKRTEDTRILFPGAIYGQGYRELLANAFCYIHATEVGGTHPALIEAMAMGNLIVANGTPENREVLGSAGIYYTGKDGNGLAEELQKIENSPDLYDGFRRSALERAATEYSWDEVVKQYEELFASLLSPQEKGAG
jgi:glycosyltransferase involved in cell wall biosynthesis